MPTNRIQHLIGFARIGTAVLAAVIALVLAGCGGDYDSATTAVSSTSSTTSEATLSPEQDLERIANKWAPLYAAARNPGACGGYDELHPYREVAAKYMAQPACERTVCKRVPNRTIRNCTPPSPGFQNSFADATVQDVAIKGRHRAAVKFSNGEAVELVGDVRPPEYLLGPAWLIGKVGGNVGRGFFE